MRDILEIKDEINSLDKETRKVRLRRAVNGLRKIEEASASLFCERGDAIHTAIVCIITGTHHLQYGPPGTAKSMLTRFLNKTIENSTYFETLLTKSSDEAQLFGPYSLKGLENDEYRRNTDGKVPEANLIFVDEVYKSNSAVLNALLSVMNEKIYHNGPDIMNLPLITMFGASNEIPEEDSSLEALHDRFLMRIYVDDIKDPANMIAVYRSNLNNDFEGMDLPAVDVEDIFLLNEYSKKVRISDYLLQEYSKLIISLRNQGIRISTRRQIMLLHAVQGEALLKKRNEAQLDDFGVIRNGLWRKLEELPAIDEALTKFISPYETQYNEIINKFKELKRDYEQITGADAESNIKMTKLINKMSDLGNQVRDYGSINKAMPKAMAQSFSKLYKEITYYTEKYYEAQDKDLLDLSPRSNKSGRRSGQSSGSDIVRSSSAAHINKTGAIDDIEESFDNDDNDPDWMV